MSSQNPEHRYRESVEPDPEIQKEKQEEVARIEEARKEEFLERVDEDQDEEEEEA